MTETPKRLKSRRGPKSVAFAQNASLSMLMEELLHTESIERRGLGKVLC